MRKLIIASFMLLFAVAGFAQENTFNKGDKVLNLGVGIGSTLYSGGYYKSAIPPISASFELGVKDNLFDEKSSLGIGAYLGYTSAKWEFSYPEYAYTYNSGLNMPSRVAASTSSSSSTYGWNYSSMILGVRGALHYQLVSKLDTYTGILLGYNIVSAKAFGTMGDYSYTAASSGIAWSWYLGGRYYFTDKFAAMAELGYGIAYLNLVVALKL